MKRVQLGNGLNQQVSRIEELTRQLHETVAGLRDGRRRVEELQEELRQECDRARAQWKAATDEVLNEGKASLARERQDQQDRLQKLLRESGTSLGALADAMTARIEEASRRVSGLEHRGAELWNQMRAEWEQHARTQDLAREELDRLKVGLEANHAECRELSATLRDLRAQVDLQRQRQEVLQARMSVMESGTRSDRETWQRSLSRQRVWLWALALGYLLTLWAALVR